MNYRERLYKNYVDSHYGVVNALSKEEYEFIAKKYKLQVLPHLPADKGSKIADLGCGPAHLLYCLQKEGYANSCGVDLSAQQIEAAAKAGVKNLINDDVMSFLDKKKDTFDAIVSHSMIEHLTKDEVINFLDLVFGALKPGGTLLLRTPNASGIFGGSLVFCDFTHEVGFTPVSLSQVLRLCGFDDINIFGETPVASDFKSAVRLRLWNGVKKLFSIAYTIEKGTGRGMWNPGKEILFEARMFAVAKKRKK